MANISERGNPILLDCRPNVLLKNECSGGNSFILDPPQIKEPAARTVSSEDLTVCVHNVCKSYTKGHPVLTNLCMNVRKGTIYGLLGSSGCGKTTLLSCIVGLKKWDSGKILVFGRRPGSRGSGIPGPRVGFMPQDIALYDHLSIKEMLDYYGQLYGMSSTDFNKQLQFLMDFLKLPPKTNIVKELSGGQKRRVSLAITLVHSPELLILDEPTVGLDPLLRESIWKYLYNMVQSRKTTIIITTHYIEEARFSNTIGVMRKGRLLVEEPPDTLLARYECDLLEDVVLKLCHKDESSLTSVSSGSNNNLSQSNGSKASRRRSNGTGVNNNAMTTVAVISDKTSGGNKSKNSYNVYDKFQENVELNFRRRSSIRLLDAPDNLTSQNKSGMFSRIKGLSTIMWIMFYRHAVFMSIVLFLPTIQLILTLFVLGTDPKDMRIGVINDELPFYSDICSDRINNALENTTFMNTSVETKSCNFQHLSCIYIEEFAKNAEIVLIPMASREAAVELVKKGEMWGYIYFPVNYTQHVTNLVLEQKFAENETLEGSRIHIRLDQSHFIATVTIMQRAYETYENFAKRLAISCNLDPKEFQLPFSYREPVFGEFGASYHDYVTPIIILTVIFEVPMLITAILFINDRKQGTMERARVAGLRFKEIMISYFLTQGSVVIGQAVICFVIMKLIYNFYVRGSLVLYFVLCVICGLCGQSSGLMLGVIFDEEVEAIMLGIFLGPVILLYEGAIWPVEGFLNDFAKTIGNWLPTTKEIDSLRSIVYRDLDFTHIRVWPGFATMTGYLVLFWVLSILIHFIRSR